MKGKERRWKIVALLAVGIAIGVAMTATPAASHVAGWVHNWNRHIKPRTDARYFTKAQAEARYYNTTETVANATNAVNAVNADTVDGRHAGCPAGTIETQGVCIETSNRPAGDIYDASIGCANAGRFLPNHLMLRAARQLPGIDLDALGEWSSTEWHDDADGWEGFAVHESGFVEPTGEGAPRKFRCIAPLISVGTITTVPSRPAALGRGGSK